MTDDLTQERLDEIRERWKTKSDEGVAWFDEDELVLRALCNTPRLVALGQQLEIWEAVGCVLNTVYQGRYKDIPALLNEIGRLRKQVKAANRLEGRVIAVHAELGLHCGDNTWAERLWHKLNHALAAFRDAMEEVEATSNSDPTSSRLEDGEAVK